MQIRYDEGTVDPDEMFWGKHVLDRFEIDVGQDAFSTLQIDLGVVAQCFYILDVCQGNGDIVVFPQDGDGP